MTTTAEDLFEARREALAMIRWFIAHPDEVAEFIRLVGEPFRAALAATAGESEP